MKSCKTIWPVLEPSGRLRNRRTALKPSDGFKTVRVLHWSLTYMYIHVYMHNYMFLMRDEKEERKKQARSNKQTRQSNTAHPKAVIFPRKNELHNYIHVHVHVSNGTILILI